MKHPQLIIPMSGIGKRFVEAGYHVPKPLIKVDGKPIIEHVYNLFPGATDVSFICNAAHLNDANTKMREVLTSFCPNAKIYEVPLDPRYGPVHAVMQIADYIKDDEEVIVSYCDYGTYWNYTKFLEELRANGDDGGIACYIGFHPHMLGSDNYAFVKEDNNYMIQIKEKEPFTNNKMAEYASNGTYYFKTGQIMKKYFKQLMDANISINNEFYVSMVYNLLVADGLKVRIFKIENMLQWGTPYDLSVYNSWSQYFRNIIQPQTAFPDIYDTTTLLPLAGHGSRFTKKGYDVPKPLIDVNGLPMIIQAIKCLPQSTHNVFVCLNEHLNNYDLGQQLKKYYPGCKIVGLDNVTEGQACTCEIGINSAQIDLNKPLLITACDNGVYYDSTKYKTLLEDKSIDVIVWSFRNNPTSKNNPNMYAWLDVDEDDNIKHVSVKKFIYKDPLKTHAIIGTMFFRKGHHFMNGLKQIYEKNIRANNEYYVDCILNELIAEGLKVKVFEVDNYICWGTPDDYETYIYWRDFFDKCEWHPYKKSLDITANHHTLTNANKETNTPCNLNKAIAFSLWSSDPKYTVGMIKNAELAKTIYPGWHIIVHVDNTVPQHIIDRLIELDCRIITKNTNGNWMGMFWRFETMADQSYDVVISRDADSRLSEREKSAVDEWIKSGKTLHIMRDHPWHCAEILGGMWGIRNKQFPLFGTLLEIAVKEIKVDYWQVDQQFLRRVVFPLLKNNSFTHDEFFEYNLDKHPFPTPRIEYQFVGQIYLSDDSIIEHHVDILRRNEYKFVWNSTIEHNQELVKPTK